MKVLITLSLLLAAVNMLQAQTLPPFELKDTENNYRTFADLKGEKVTIIDFWATWCKPCRKAIPELNKLYEEFRSDGLEIIGISCDGPRSTAKVGPLISSMQIKYPVLLDVNSDVMNNLNFGNFPTLLAVDGTGKILYIHEGFETGDEIEIREEIEKLLGK